MPLTPKNQLPRSSIETLIGGMQQSPIQSPCSLSRLQRPDEMNNLENNEDPFVNDEYVPDQIEDVQKQDCTGRVDQLDHNMQNSKEHIICATSIHMLSPVNTSYDKFLTKSPILIPELQLSRLNPKRSIILHSEARVVDQTPIHRIRCPGRYNTSPYITTFESSFGSSSKLPVIFDQKHPFDSIFGTHDASLYTNFWKWLREGLLARHKNKINDDDQYKKKRSTLTELMNFGICTVSDKNWFYKLANRGQLLDDSGLWCIHFSICGVLE
ncbi:hypothetical protein RDI58_010451 [Solanum bulbocastanum]|uniref:Uncharacterized protein n=1 Tax=Solanum bulbocastanum TaxID=147425 RepID=A0AAN8TQJ2_SOLBU